MNKTSELAKYPIKDVVCKFFSELHKDKNHRYMSWEHCYRYFQSYNTDTDHASLHLAFYLASWGMYRGSTGILWKDYKIHNDAVAIIMNPKYDVLKGEIIGSDVEEYKNTLLSLFKELSVYYGEITYSNGKKERNVTATGTLITKIILGTLGAFPALDRLFCDGFKVIYGQRVSEFNHRTIDAVLDFVRDNKVQITKVQDEVYRMNGYNIKYPPMKIVDMYFWQIGALKESE